MQFYKQEHARYYFIVIIFLNLFAVLQRVCQPETDVAAAFAVTRYAQCPHELPCKRAGIPVKEWCLQLTQQMAWSVHHYSCLRVHNAWLQIHNVLISSKSKEVHGQGQADV